MRGPCTEGSEAIHYRNEDTVRASEGHRMNCEHAVINCSNGTRNCIEVIEQTNGVKCLTTNNVGC